MTSPLHGNMSVDEAINTIDGDGNRSSARQGMCRAIQELSVSDEVRLSMLAKITEALSAISITLGGKVPYLCEIGTKEGMRIRKAFCRKMIADMELIESLG